MVPAAVTGKGDFDGAQGFRASPREIGRSLPAGGMPPWPVDEQVLAANDVQTLLGREEVPNM